MMYSHSMIMKSMLPTAIMNRMARVPGFLTGIGITNRTETISMDTKYSGVMSKGVMYWKERRIGKIREAEVTGRPV
jgi:hypothetical protein